MLICPHFIKSEEFFVSVTIISVPVKEKIVEQNSIKKHMNSDS
jgi:hypothetical protein